METACYMSYCQNKVMYFCSCGNNKTYCCNQHLNSHLNFWPHEDNVDHKITSLFAKVPQGFVENCTRSLESLKVVEASVKNFSDKAKAGIIFYEKKILEEIHKLKQVYENLMNTLKSELIIKKDLLLSFLPVFNSIYVYSPLQKENILLTQIKAAFSDLYFKQSDETALYWDSSLNLLKSVSLERAISLSIELKNFKKNSNSLELSNSFVYCQVSLDTYFIKERERTTYPILLSVKNQTIEELPGRGDLKNYGACILSENIIHFFINSSIIFECFDLSALTWKYLTNLPKASQDIKANSLRNKIIYSGFGISEVYLFQCLYFESILSLAVNTHKVICPGWIVSDMLLHENTSDSKFWVSYPTTFTLLNSPSSAVILNKEFIFFIYDPSSLIRIDTLKKSLIAIPIT